MHIKTKDFYKDIADDVEKRLDTSNYEVNRPLPTGKNKKVIGLIKDELGGKILTEFVALRLKTYSYLTDDGKEDKKATNSLYRSPSQSSDSFEEFADNLQLSLDKISNQNPFLTVVLGDFNNKSSNWYKHDQTIYEGSKIDAVSSQFSLQ